MFTCMYYRMVIDYYKCKFHSIFSSNSLDAKFDEAVGHIEDIIMGKTIHHAHCALLLLTRECSLQHTKSIC